MPCVRYQRARKLQGAGRKAAGLNGRAATLGPRDSGVAADMNGAWMNKTKTGILAITVLSLTAAASSVLAQSAASRYPITPEQRSTADQVAQAGVPLSELAPNAPERYTVKSRRHALGPVQHVPDEPVALARAVGHEQGADPQPAPDLSGTGARAGQGRRPRPTAGRGRRRIRHRQARAADPRPRRAAPFDSEHSEQPDRAVPVAAARA